MTRAVQLFYTINGWAGQYELFDEAMRLLYIASVPLLATFLMGLLTLARPPRKVEPLPTHSGNLHFSQSSRGAVALAAIMAVTLCLLLVYAVNVWAQRYLGLSILSPRPFVTHRVNLLVVEPNDNSFPSPEVALIAALWVCIWASSQRWNVAAMSFALLASFARIFCGTHYPADVLIGFLIGCACAAFCLSLCGVVLRFSDGPYRQRAWRLRFQAGMAVAVLALLISLGALTVRNTPRLATAWEGVQQQRAGQVRLVTSSASSLRSIDTVAPTGATVISAKTTTTTSSSTLQHEGEGDEATHATEATADDEEMAQFDMGRDKPVPVPGVVSLGGYLPREEQRLLLALQRARLGHGLVRIEVAALRDKGFEMQCAAVHFQVRDSGFTERKRVARTAAQIVRTAFAINSSLQNVDVIGEVLSNPERDGVRYPVFNKGEVPVFTASVQRKKLVLGKQPALSGAKVDAGTWLTARSRLYFNELVLPTKPEAVNVNAQPVFMEATPAVPASTPTPTPTQTPAAKTTATPREAQPPVPPVGVPRPATRPQEVPRSTPKKPGVKPTVPGKSQPAQKQGYSKPAAPRKVAPSQAKPVVPKPVVRKPKSQVAKKRAPVVQRVVPQRKQGRRPAVRRSTDKRRSGVRRRTFVPQRKRTYRRYYRRTWRSQ